MHVNGVFIDDTFAEAFPMRAARIVVTAVNDRWAREAALKLTGFATSVIACKMRGGHRASSCRMRRRTAGLA
jgi:formylmethanofuran--tetrahydromethanopterin N-formyltransferase